DARCGGGARRRLPPRVGRARAHRQRGAPRAGVAAAVSAPNVSVVPAKAGIHDLRPVVMGPAFVGTTADGECGGRSTLPSAAAGALFARRRPRARWRSAVPD